MMKVSTLYVAIMAVSLSLSAAWGFSLPKKAAASSTQLEMSYYRGYDDYSLGSSFLIENQMNDPYSSQRIFDRNRDDVHFSPYSQMNYRRGYYNDYYGGGGWGYGSGYRRPYGYGGGYGGYYGNGYGYGYNRYNPYYEGDGYYRRSRGPYSRWNPYYSGGFAYDE